MQKLLLLFLVVLGISCSEDTSVNEPAFQAVRDSVFYKSSLSYARMVGSQGVQLLGEYNNVKIYLDVSNYAEGTYILGPEENNSAEYISAKGKRFNTAQGGEGEIVVSRIEDSTFTGNFKFRAKSFTDSTEVVLTKGVFYKVPIKNIIESEPEDPVVATQFACKINTVTFKPQAVGATLLDSDISGFGSTSTIIIGLIFPKDIEKGIYKLEDVNTDQPYRASYISNGSPSFIQSGQLEITSHNLQEGSVGGTFFFSAMNKGNVEVTEGVFGFNYKN